MNNVIALPTRSVQITLQIHDADVVHELEKRDEGEIRNRFATEALRLGVLALRQANGALDADVIRREREALLAEVGSMFRERASDLSRTLEQTVSQVFDPKSGVFQQRLDQLVKPNGDLEKILGAHLDGDTSVLARTLAEKLGEKSPLFKMLSPQQSDGLLATMQATLKKALDGQRDEVLKQFSLDRKDSALSRLREEVMTSNGQLRSELANDVNKVVAEFSLDNADGALSRLMNRVEQAHKIIVNEFSLDHDGSAFHRLSTMLEKTNAAVEASLTLDDETSPLARLRRELVTMFEGQRATSTEFQADMRAKMEALTMKRREAARSTTHGNAFEDEMSTFLDHLAKRVGDVFEKTTHVPGKGRCKTGDIVIEMGPESAAPGAKIVFEAKAEKKYSMKMARAEIAEARENRDAQVGVFIFARDYAPADLDGGIERIGNDLFLVWDPSDVLSDVYLKAAFGVARTLVVRERAMTDASELDLAALDRLIEDIGKHLAALEKIESAARSVKKNGESILAGAEAMRETLERQIDDLQNAVEALRNAVGDT